MLVMHSLYYYNYADVDSVESQSLKKGKIIKHKNFMNYSYNSIVNWVFSQLITLHLYIYIYGFEIHVCRD